jgi:hypothetical protein
VRVECLRHCQVRGKSKTEEEEVFDDFATRQLGVKGADVAKFRKLALLSAAAVLRGNLSLQGKVSLTWARDDFMAAPDLTGFIRENLVTDVLAERAESVAMWKQIESLAQQIHFPDQKTKEFVAVSSTYGRIKYAIAEQAWTILLYGAAGDPSKNYNCKKLSPAIAEYDKLWAQWRTLLAAHPEACATIYKDKAFQDKPGIGAAVDRYRKSCDAIAAREN